MMRGFFTLVWGFSHARFTLVYELCTINMYFYCQRGSLWIPLIYVMSSTYWRFLFDPLRRTVVLAGRVVRELCSFYEKSMGLALLY